VHGHVQLQADNLDCVQLGELADKAWLARVTQQSHVLAALPPEENLEELSDTVAALNMGKPRSKHVQPKKRNQEAHPHLSSTRASRRSSQRTSAPTTSSMVVRLATAGNLRRAS